MKTMDPQQVISLLKDLMLIGAALVGAWVAKQGLSTWQRQLQGSAEYDLARRILKLTYRFRDTMKQARHGALLPHELPPLPQEEGQHWGAAQKRRYQESHAYEARRKKILDIKTALQTELLEAEALWGKELQDKFTAVFQLERELFNAIGAAIFTRTQRQPQRCESLLKHTGSRSQWSTSR